MVISHHLDAPLEYLRVDAENDVKELIADTNRELADAQEAVGDLLWELAEEKAKNAAKASSIRQSLAANQTVTSPLPGQRTLTYRMCCLMLMNRLRRIYCHKP